MKFLVVPVLCATATACAWETLDTSYVTAREAVDAGMVEKGWIPKWLPRDATNLREVHDVDSRVSELSFAVPSATAIHLPAECRPAAYADTVRAWIRRDWWPDDAALERSYVFFRCQADHTEYRFVAISKAGDRVLHWRTYAH